MLESLEPQAMEWSGVWGAPSALPKEAGPLLRKQLKTHGAKEGERVQVGTWLSMVRTLTWEKGLLGPFPCSRIVYAFI